MQLKNYRNGIRNAWSAVKTSKNGFKMKQFKHRRFQHGQYVRHCLLVPYVLLPMLGNASVPVLNCSFEPI